MCKGEKISIAVYDVTEAKTWKSGDVVIGGRKWKCKLGSMNSEKPGIYVKISSIMWAGPNRVDVITSSAGPLDAFENAKIEMHYIPMEQNHHRKKRHVSNVLTNVLGTIDWNADYVASVPFNPSNRPIILFKRPSDKDVKVLTSDSADLDKIKRESDFYMSCLSCTGLSKLSYHLTMTINKVNNKPQIVKYLSQVESKDLMHYNITAESFSEITLKHRQQLWESSPQNLAKIQLAVFKKLPPIELSIDYSSQSFIDLTAITKNAAKLQSIFDLTGKNVISESASQGQTPTQQTTPYEWSVKNTRSQFSSNSTLNGTVQIFQKINLNTSIGWSLRDIHITSGPPLTAEIKPTVFLNATSDEITHCDNVSVDVVGHFSRPSDWFDVNAFGIHVWHALMSKDVDVTIPIVSDSLTRHCRANCFGEAEKNALSEMEEICGPVTEKIVRGDRNFSNLEQLWGDFILFESEEKDSDWCGNQFRSCIDCTNRTVGDDVDTKCADRMMTTTMATRITKLGKFIRAEWPTRKLIVKEAWDEPTSDYPNGRHGNNSLYYEGKAVRAGISRQIVDGFTKLAFERKASVLQRLGELAVCSGFGFVKADDVNNDIEVCMSKTPTESKGRKRRSTGSARDPNTEAERKAFDDKLEKLETPNFKREELKPYLLKPGEFFPKSKTLHEACGPPYYHVSPETLKYIHNIYQYPFDNVHFLPEGSSGSSCSSETRACKESCPYVSSSEPRAWCTSRTMLAGTARRTMNLANWIEANAAYAGEIMFLVDVSGSITSQVYSKFRSLLKTIIEKHVKLNRNSMRQVEIGVASFSNTYRVVTAKRRSISTAHITALNYQASEDTDIKTALEQVKTEFTHGVSNKTRLLVLMTDGMSNDPVGVKRAAQSLKSDGIKIATVAAGGYIDDVLLKEISSSKNSTKLYFEYFSTTNIEDRILSIVSEKQQVKVKASDTPDLMKDVRGIKLLPPEEGSVSSSELAALAIKAGFHCIHHNTDSSVDAFMKPHDGFRMQTQLFPSINLIMVQPPIGEEHEYEYPKNLSLETPKSLLFDGFDMSANVSDSYKIRDFLSLSKRSFRLDPILVECLELAVDDYGAYIPILPGHAYRPRSANQENMSRRHKEEKYRYQSGQALGLKGGNLLDVGTSLMRSCTPLLRLQMRSLGIGCHKDYLYFDIRPSVSKNISDLIQIWNVDNEILFQNLSDAKEALTKGGPPIIPDKMEIACAEPQFGEDLYYLSFKKNKIGFCTGLLHSSECKKTLQEREKIEKKLLTDLVAAAGSGTISRSDIQSDLQKCLTDKCGGCVGSGSMWFEKVQYCANAIHTYLEKVRNAFKGLHDTTTFFNTDNANSTMHSLACHDGNMCVENTQLYSLLSPIVTAKYKPNGELSVEELLFSPNGNPTPLTEIVEQELAFRCSGNVRIFIENERDISSLRGVLKVLMVYNRQVTNVEFNIAHNVKADNVLGTVQKKIETWATSACPKRSRLAIAPFTTTTINQGRTKRSLERSKERNDAKFKMRNWELEWLFST